MRNALFFYFFLLIFNLKAQTEIPLYEGKIPHQIPTPNLEKRDSLPDGILRISQISQPTLRIYLPPKEKATGAAVVICPGGGYWIVAADHEGYQVAKAFNEMGVAAFVLKYRLPDAKTSAQPSLAPLQDAQQAIRLVRKRAAVWQIDVNRVGILGFSAGGHLAATAGTHFEKSYIDNPEKINLRPDFMVLIYPVISADTLHGGHQGSFTALIGNPASRENELLFSNEKQVSPRTPPTFLVHADNDEGVKPENSLYFYMALRKNKVPAEMHIYQKGGHGFGLRNYANRDLWLERCKNWMDANGWLAP
jgi:acetyl esterase/lipase